MICPDYRPPDEDGPIESDQRKRTVWLTGSGAWRLEAAIPVWRSAHAALAARLEPELAQRLAIASEALIGG